MPQKPFGKLPSGRRLERIKQSPNYRDGSFSNLAETKMMAEGTNYLNLMVNFFSKGVDRNPTVLLPSIHTNLLSLADEEPTVVWFGHSSYFIRINGKNLLIDPVLSERASPFQFLGAKAFETTRRYTVADFPPIDALILTHDHYDHLDYNSIIRFLPKVKAFYTALGVGSHLNYWGVDESHIHELDWWEGKTILPGVDLISTPARHFSGRGLTRNKTLWSSFVLKTKEYSLFLGGDSGYDEAFKTIGNTYGPFDLAILECGQYNSMWPQIHMMPEETVQASSDLRAKVLLPVHWGKFTLVSSSVEGTYRKGIKPGKISEHNHNYAHDWRVLITDPAPSPGCLVEIINTRKVALVLFQDQRLVSPTAVTAMFHFYPDL